jgi:hypothetical protein
MFAWLAQIGIGSIVGKLAEAYKARENAKTDQERIAADERIAMLQAQASAQRPVDAWMRIGFAMPFALFNAKIIVWDKMLGLGRTDPLSPDLIKVELVVIGFYFLHVLVRG